MRKLLFLYLLIQSIYSYGQDRIDYINIENSSSHIWSNSTIYIESPNADFASPNNNKDGKVLVEIKMNLKDNKDYKKIKYIDRIDYEEVTKIY